MGYIGKTILGLLLIVMAILLGFLPVEFWPTHSPNPDGTIPDAKVSLFGFFDLTIDAELKPIVVVILAGGFGSYVLAATSFALTLAIVRWSRVG
jgi:hypothetical protein